MSLPSQAFVSGIHNCGLEGGVGSWGRTLTGGSLDKSFLLTPLSLSFYNHEAGDQLPWALPVREQRGRETERVCCSDVGQ